MPSAPDGVLPISICYISAHARCSWRIKSDRFMRSTGSGFRLELRGICLLNLLTWSAVLPQTLLILLRDHPHATYRSPQEVSNPLILLTEYFLRIKYAERLEKPVTSIKSNT